MSYWTKTTFFDEAKKEWEETGEVKFFDSVTGKQLFVAPRGRTFQEFIKQLRDPEPVFENSEVAAGDIRTLHSYFVDTGYEDGHVKGLAANDIEFIVKEGETINTAVVIPLMKNMNAD